MDLCQSTSPWDFRNLRIMKRILKASRYRGTNINSLKIIWNQNDIRILNISHWHWKILGKCINIQEVKILTQNSIPSQSIYQVQRQNKNILTYASFPKRYPSMHHDIPHDIPGGWISPTKDIKQEKIQYITYKQGIHQKEEALNQTQIDSCIEGSSLWVCSPGKK